jgi:hypothetical protein
VLDEWLLQLSSQQKTHLNLYEVERLSH